MSKSTVLTFFSVIVLLLIICACLYKTNETFSNAIHYCVKRVTQHTTGKRIPELNPTQQTMQLDDAKNACTQNRRCSFFTCKDLTDTDACDKATFYHKQQNSPLESQQDAHMMFKKSHRPCHNYCFEYMGPHKKGQVVSTEPKARTIEQAKQECDRRPECKFFTCDGQSTDSTSCSGMKMYSNTRPTRKIASANNAGQPKEMYIKSQQACKTSVNAHPLQHKATQNAYTLPYAYNIHGGMKKYSNSFGGMVAMPDKVDNRVCQMNRHSMRGNNSEGEHDTNCFLDNTTEGRAVYFNMFKLEGAYDGQPYSFYKDENHNVYHRKTDMCCADDVAYAQRQAKRHSHEKIELPKAHPCNNLSDSVFAEHCNGLCKDPKMVYRGDLKMCVPKSKKCHYKNAMTCDRNSPHKAGFERECAPKNQGCSDKQCRKHHMNVQKRSCKEGKPYYTFVGSYDETVNMYVKLQALENNVGGNHRFVLRDPATNADWGTIHSVLLHNEFFYGKPNQIKVTQNGEEVIYNVLSLSFEMQYIELYAQNESPQKAKYYVLEKRKRRTR